MGLTRGKAWFEPKRFGYGATPANWKGWAAVGVFVVLIVIDMTCFHGAPRWGLVAAATVGFTALAYVKTGGEWRWRWDKR